MCLQDLYTCGKNKLLTLTGPTKNRYGEMLPTCACVSQGKRKHQAAHTHVTEQSLTQRCERERYTNILRLLSILEITDASTIPLSAPVVLEIINMTASVPWNSVSEERRPHTLEVTLFIRT